MLCRTSVACCDIYLDGQRSYQVLAGKPLLMQTSFVGLDGTIRNRFPDTLYRVERLQVVTVSTSLFC
jgi:hypothetical protein